MTDRAEGMLGPYRALDLAGEQGVMCGKVLGDLGADVIKIERPGGDPMRNLGPFYHDDPHPEKSLFWFSYNTNKKGITLDIETADGRAVFRRLVEKTDIVIESSPPGYMDGLGLGYADLEKINPGVILVSITPFGQTGPYKDYKGSDIVSWAMGGYMYTIGDSDRPPVQISHHAQMFLHGGIQGAEGAVMAIYYREMTGEGQQVDVSIQDAASRCTPERVTMFWDFEKRVVHRGGRPLSLPRIWPCKDGYVYAIFWSGVHAKRWNSPIVRWMEDLGMSTDYLSRLDWDAFNLQTATREELDGIVEPARRFFASLTKEELLNGALEHNAQIYPASDAGDIVNNRQLASREYWVELEHPELGDTITYPGAFTRTTGVPPAVTRRAPLIGEHNIEVYEGELGMSREELLILKQAGVI